MKGRNVESLRHAGGRLPSLRIIYDVEGWAFHHKALALQKYAPADFEVSLAPLPGAEVSLSLQQREQEAARALGDTPIDIVFLLPATNIKVVNGVLRQRRWRSKLVAGWTGGAPSGIAAFRHLYWGADAWIINNHAFWESLGRLARTFVIANGVDLEIFTIERLPQLRTPKVVWTGSEFHRQLKGHDGFMVPLQGRLRELGIACELLLVDSFGAHKRTPAQMAQWYNSATVLVCASASEGTPNPALEAAACGCTVVSTRVGNMPELIRHGVNGYFADRSIDGLLRATRDACTNYLRLSAAMQRDIQSWHWGVRSADFFGVFREVLHAPEQARTLHPPGAAAELFGTQSVEPCVLETGERSFDPHLRRDRF
jgi:glycosyltransferase involved in cell wall biosynthesis